MQVKRWPRRRVSFSKQDFFTIFDLQTHLYYRRWHEKTSYMPNLRVGCFDVPEFRKKISYNLIISPVLLSSIFVKLLMENNKLNLLHAYYKSYMKYLLCDLIFIIWLRKLSYKKIFTKKISYMMEPPMSRENIDNSYEISTNVEFFTSFFFLISKF